LLMGPREAVPPLGKLLQQPLIKAVHRKVLDTARRARKPWMAHVASCRTVAWRVLAPLMQLEQQLLQVYSDGSLSSTPPLSEQFELLAELHQEQQGVAADAAAFAPYSSQPSLPINSASFTSSACQGSEILPAVFDSALQDSLSAVLGQLAAARPVAACRIAQLHEELLQLVAGRGVLSSFEPVQPCAAVQGPTATGCGTGVEPVLALVPVQQEGNAAAGQLLTGAHFTASCSTETAPTASSACQSAGAAVQDTLPDLSTPKITEAAASASACAGSFGAHSNPPCATATWDTPLTAEDTTVSNSPISWAHMQLSQLFAPSSMLDAGSGRHCDQQTLYLPPLSSVLGAGYDGQHDSQHNPVALLASPLADVLGSHEPVQPCASNHRLAVLSQGLQQSLQQGASTNAGQLFGAAADSDERQFVISTQSQDILDVFPSQAACHSVDCSAGAAVQDTLPDHSDVDPISDAACKGLDADAWCTVSRQKPFPPAAATTSYVEGMEVSQLEGCKGLGVSGSSMGGSSGVQACLPLAEHDYANGIAACPSVSATGYELVQVGPSGVVGDEARLGVDVSTAASQVVTVCSPAAGAVRRRKGVVGVCVAALLACRAMRRWCFQG
jgi:hypothetical protein